VKESRKNKGQRGGGRRALVGRICGDIFFGRFKRGIKGGASFERGEGRRQERSFNLRRCAVRAGEEWGETTGTSKLCRKIAGGGRGLSKKSKNPAAAVGWQELPPRGW